MFDPVLSGLVSFTLNIQNLFLYPIKISSRHGYHFTPCSKALLSPQREGSVHGASPALKGTAQGGSALLVFLGNLSMEQSTSQRHTHKIGGYAARAPGNPGVGGKRGPLGGCCGRAASAPGEEPLPPLPSRCPPGGTLGSSGVWLPDARAKLVRGGWGAALAGLPSLSGALSPRLRQGVTATAPSPWGRHLRVQPHRAGPMPFSAVDRLLTGEMDALTC